MPRSRPHGPGAMSADDGGGARGAITSPASRLEAILVEAERIAHLGSYEWDVQSNSVYRSDELCRIFGLAREEFKPSFEGYLERVHPEDRSRTRGIIENAYRERIPFEFEERIVHPDGSIRMLCSQGKWIFDADGNPVKLIGICSDITESKFAAGLLSAGKHVLECIARRLPLEHVLDEICRRIDQINPPVMSSILLLEPDGKRLRPVAAPSLPECWTRAITPLEIGPLAGSCGTAAFKRETVVVADITQDPLWTSHPAHLKIALQCGLRACWSTPILSAAGELLGTFALYQRERAEPLPRDLDLIKQVTHLASIAIEHERAMEGLQRARDEMEKRVQDRTAELVRANEKLEELDRLKSLFLASMSHELRTPLNSIIGFTEILSQGMAGPVNEEQKMQLNIVSASSRHLLSLINDLLDVSRIEAGKMELQHAPFDFVEVVNEVIETLKPMADQKTLRLASQVPAPHIKMVGDRKRIFQVLLNLVNNAVKYTDHGSVEILVRIAQDNLWVCVSDTGIGIKQEQMGLLFEAFRQLNGSAKRVYEGTGLGLHLCRKLVNLMQGQISAESQRGKGSRFTFTVPLRQPAPGNR